MNRIKRIPLVLHLFILLLLLLHCPSAHAAQAEAIPVGKQLPEFTVGIPDSPETQKYLGVKSDAPFTLSKIGAKLVLIEFFSSL